MLHGRRVQGIAVGPSRDRLAHPLSGHDGEIRHRAQRRQGPDGADVHDLDGVERDAVRDGAAVGSQAAREHPRRDQVDLGQYGERGVYRRERGRQLRGRAQGGDRLPGLSAAAARLRFKIGQRRLQGVLDTQMAPVLAGIRAGYLEFSRAACSDVKTRRWRVLGGTPSPARAPRGSTAGARGRPPAAARSRRTTARPRASVELLLDEDAHPRASHAQRRRGSGQPLRPGRRGSRWRRAPAARARGGHSAKATSSSYIRSAAAPRPVVRRRGDGRRGGGRARTCGFCGPAGRRRRRG